jgi:hypothetical protein
MDSRRGIALPVAILAVGAVLAGCGTTNSSSSATAPASTAASTPAAAPSASGTGSSGTGSSGTAQATTAAGTGSGTAAWCTAAQLKISYTDNSQIKQGALNGMSHDDSVVMVTNISSASCETGGYPGVAALDSSGTQIMQAARATDTSKTITLAPGAVASAMVSANSASCDKPVTVAGLLVTAPNERTPVRLGAPGTFCLASLQIGTLKPGNAAGLPL